MPREKPCSTCGHTAMMHHFIKGTRAGSCAQNNCRCQSYQFVEIETEKGVILDPDLIRGFMDLRRAYLSLEKKMRERGLELK